ncbi:MAG: NADH-quinone oxidoreductase subunit C [Anaerolineae bacterium]
MMRALESAALTACSRENPLVSRDIAGEVTINIPAHSLKEVVRAGMAPQGWLHLSAITAQQRDSVNIELLYHFWQQGGITLRITCLVDEPSVPSLADIIPMADWYEREICELFGIAFLEHPNPERLFLPDDWNEPPPMRKQDVTI